MKVVVHSETEKAMVLHRLEEQGSTGETEIIIEKHAAVGMSFGPAPTPHMIEAFGQNRPRTNKQAVKQALALAAVTTGMVPWPSGVNYQPTVRDRDTQTEEERAARIAAAEAKRQRKAQRK